MIKLKSQIGISILIAVLPNLSRTLTVKGQKEVNGVSTAEEINIIINTEAPYGMVII